MKNATLLNEHQDLTFVLFCFLFILTGVRVTDTEAGSFLPLKTMAPRKLELDSIKRFLMEMTLEGYVRMIMVSSVLVIYFLAVTLVIAVSLLVVRTQRDEGVGCVLCVVCVLGGGMHVCVAKGASSSFGIHYGVKVVWVSKYYMHV